MRLGLLSTLKRVAYSTNGMHLETLLKMDTNENEYIPWSSAPRELYSRFENMANKNVTSKYLVSRFESFSILPYLGFPWKKDMCCFQDLPISSTGAGTLYRRSRRFWDKTSEPKRSCLQREMPKISQPYLFRACHLNNVLKRFSGDS